MVSRQSAAAIQHAMPSKFGESGERSVLKSLPSLLCEADFIIINTLN